MCVSVLLFYNFVIFRYNYAIITDITIKNLKCVSMFCSTRNALVNILRIKQKLFMRYYVGYNHKLHTFACKQ